MTAAPAVVSFAGCASSANDIMHISCINTVYFFTQNPKPERSLPKRTANGSTPAFAGLSKSANGFLFNSTVINSDTCGWRQNAYITFYFDGATFHQLIYPKAVDMDTTYTGFFEQNLLGFKLPINPDQSIDRYQLVLERGDGTFDKTLATASNTTATKAVNINAIFKVDGLIWYNSSTSSYSAGTTLTGTALHLIQTRQQSGIITYAMNGQSKLTPNNWLYLVGIPQGNPMLFKLDPTDFTSWYTTTVPAQEDGKVYIRLGYYETGAYFDLFSDHPAYWFKDGYFRPYLTRGDV
jgi:hypothetical protein